MTTFTVDTFNDLWLLCIYPFPSSVNEDKGPCLLQFGLAHLRAPLFPPLSTANWLFNSPRTPSTKAIQGHLR
ncbi:hypothetical protein PGT21_010013 [Puccinia graminis f. sp. tritici]|uniref:Uncharacterized protein n=1 Tax=Puccinia graminis f. sp. tritici TaxID=56615 RepID=A0A5B0MAA9_PUCGR|nr:hypothetical protein PGTUg99_020061 [Puccinia graminis f. sp. tritici]KAA1090669.1 hypothetical protein PGT21_010013 [Puccinia graminis f. sp. tritici]